MRYEIGGEIRASTWRDDCCSDDNILWSSSIYMSISISISANLPFPPNCIMGDTYPLPSQTPSYSILPQQQYLSRNPQYKSHTPRFSTVRMESSTTIAVITATPYPFPSPSHPLFDPSNATYPQKPRMRRSGIYNTSPAPASSTAASPFPSPSSVLVLLSGLSASPSSAPIRCLSPSSAH